MLEQERLQKIHFLARKSRLEGLSQAEKEEQIRLRLSYLQSLRRFVQAMDTQKVKRSKPKVYKSKS